MKAAVYRRFGPPDVLGIEEVEKPAVGDDDVLVRVRATSVNPADWHTLTGTPLIARPAFGLRRPKDERLGNDYAGTVESTGKNVIRFKAGDEVFGATSQASAEYVSVAQDRVVDYTKEDFALGDKPYDLMVDIAGSRPWSDCRRVLKPAAAFVMVGAPKGNLLLGPVSKLIAVRLASVGSKRRVVFFIARITA